MNNKYPIKLTFQNKFKEEMKMAKYKFYVSTGYVGTMREEVIEIPDDELEGLSEEGKDDYIYEAYFQDWLANNADMGFYEED